MDKRQIDAKVAEAMGWEWYTVVGVNVLLPLLGWDATKRMYPQGKHGLEDNINSERFYNSERGGPTMPIVSRYSTDISAAWQVVEWMRNKGWNVALRWAPAEFDGWLCEFESQTTIAYRFGYGATESEAICLAFLEAMGIEMPVMSRLTT